jgi:cytochrome c553
MDRFVENRSIFILKAIRIISFTPPVNKMIKSVINFIFPFIICSSFVMAQVSAGEAGANLTPELAAGKERANQICSNCHGLDGQAASGGNSAISPKITAQQKSYLIAKLKDYKSGKIEHPQMTFIAQMLSDQEIDNISEWYSRIKMDSPWFTEEPASSLTAENKIDENLTPEVQAGKIKAGQICANCHGLYGRAVSGGNSAIVPNLTAQQKGYLIARLKDYKSGKIEHPQMSLVAKMLTEQDIKNVSAWYSGIEVTVFDPNLGLSN